MASLFPNVQTLNIGFTKPFEMHVYKSRRALVPYFVKGFDTFDEMDMYVSNNYTRAHRRDDWRGGALATYEGLNLIAIAFNG